METIDVLLEHFAWYEENHEQMNPPHNDKFEFLSQLKKEFYKECIDLFTRDPETFRALCEEHDFCKQIEMYSLSGYVDHILHGKHGAYLSSYFKNDVGKNYKVIWRGTMTCDVIVH